MSSSHSAVSADSTGASNNAFNNNKNNKEIKVGKLEQRAIEGKAKKLALMNAYKKLLRVIKIAERYYENGSNKERMPLEKEKIKRFLGSAKIYRRLPNINENMTNEEIQKIIEKQKMKMIQGVLRGQFPAFKIQTEELGRLQKRKADTAENKERLRIMRNNLLEKHSKLKGIHDAQSLIKQFFITTVKPLKESFEKYEKTTQKMKLKKEEMNEARDERKKKQAELQKYKRFVKLFKAKQKKIKQAKVKAIQKSKENKAKQAEKKARENAKISERTARDDAKQAYQEKKKAIRDEKEVEKARKEAEKEARRVQREQKAAERAVEKKLRKAQSEAKQAFKQAAILTAPRNMTNAQLRNLGN